MSNGAASDAGEELGFRDLVETLWAEKWLITAVTAVASVLAVAYALLATEIYRSEALIQIREEPGTRAGFGAMLGQFGGLADLAGVSFGGSGDRAVAIATLKSRALIEAFIREEQLLPKLYPSKWDAERRAWTDPDPDNAPTIWEGYRYFTENVLVTVDDTVTGLLKVAIEWHDPAEAQRWVTELVARTNALLKARAIQEGERNLEYLQQQSKSIGQVELQQALFSLVESEHKKLMLAKGGAEFALRTIDPAVVPMKRARPNRPLVAILGFTLGGFAAVVFVLVRRVWREAPARA